MLCNYDDDDDDESTACKWTNPNFTVVIATLLLPFMVKYVFLNSRPRPSTNFLDHQSRRHKIITQKRPILITNELEKLWCGIVRGIFCLTVKADVFLRCQYPPLGRIFVLPDINYIHLGFIGTNIAGVVVGKKRYTRLQNWNEVIRNWRKQRLAKSRRNNLFFEDILNQL
jgi:hypothetical protein